ncbi:PAS domain S-box protein [Flavobacterium sp. MFBS3-15]|uniref:PAS domain S-box protein n=1 Tax=Flavobacterium sp. MFBS3-15 TaxID=2989816 RepID=UPI002235CF5E|nr:PAS domain S-box protein [Flavobacterium sp. MFBS3-15]MCW4470859.1 PAS domain S-box protein [Flavobacterium sp. MFBS3-15]
MENLDITQPFPRGGGEMGELIRNFDWATSPIGPIETWPVSLKNAVSTLLYSKFPMFLFWGDDNIQFYNDAFRQMLGHNGKHPDALGQKAIDCWIETWDIVGPLIYNVKNEAEGIYFEDLLIPIYRNGEMQDGYWTFSYSPILDERGMVQGVLCISTETTEKVNGLSRIIDSKKELEFAIDAAELGVWDLNPETGRFSGNARLKSWFGLKPDNEIPLEIATKAIAEKDRERVIAAINKALEHSSGGVYNIEYTVINPRTREERLLRAKGRAWFNENKVAYRFNGTAQDITENRKAQEEVAEANQLADIATKSAGMGLFRVDLTTGEINYSPMFAYILTGDINKREISRKAFMRYIHPDDLPERARALEEGKKNNEFYYSPRLIWDDGSVHRIVVMGSNSFDADGKAVTFSGTVRDISVLENQVLALQKAESEKRESDAMFRHVTNSSPVGLWLSDTDGTLTYVNGILAEWTGRSVTELLENGWINSIIEADRKRTVATFIEVMGQLAHFDVMFRLQKSDGSIIWCRTAGDPYYDENGRFAGYAGYCMDIDEIIEGRQALTESEQRFKAIIEEAPVATCLFTGPDFKIEVANELMLAYWGKDKSVLGKPLIQGLPELEGQPFLDILNDIYKTGRTHSEIEAYAKLEVNGVLGDYYFDYTYKPLFDSDGKIYGIIDMAMDVTDRVIAQRRIDESRKQLLDSFEQSPVGIAIISKQELAFTMANKFYGELIDRLPETIIGKPLLEALPELKGQGFDVLLEEVIATGEAYTANEVAINLLRQGRMETVYLDFAYQPMHASSGEVSGVLVVAIDVTQQVQSRQKVEMSEAKLRSIIATAPAGIGLFVGRDLVIEMPNQTFIDIVGKGWDIVGKPLREAMPELVTHGQPFLKILDDVYTTGKMYQSFGDQVKIVQNGILTYNYYNITYTPVFDENNEVYAILDIAVDVTEAVLARQKLEDSQAALRGAIELAELATWRYNIKENTFNFSERFMDWLGFDEGTKSLAEAYEPLPEDYVKMVDEKIKATLAAGSDGLYENEHPIVNSLTGQVRIIHAQAQVSYDIAGNPEYLTGTAQDVTKERKLQQQLEFEVKQRTEELLHANTELAELNNALQLNNQELNQFAYIASHDLQEPARKISIFSKMLQESLGTMEERPASYLKKINIAADRMGNLIRDVLSYSQLSKNNTLFEITDLNSILADNLTDFELIMEQTGAQVTADTLPVIDAIPLQMSQLFGNLVSNSLKYKRPDISPVITISASHATKEEIAAFATDAAPAYYKIEFRDNGIGFDSEYADRIFQIFQRLHGKSEFSGTGIGLAICKKIVLNHHGHIEAASREGEGAVFTIYLPERQQVKQD